MEKTIEEINYAKQVLRYIIYAIIVLGLTALAFYLSIGKDAKLVFYTLRGANLWYIGAILLILIFCILLRSICIYSLVRSHAEYYFFHRAIAIDQIGVLYRMVTPAGLGGHIMESYTYRKQGFKLGEALSFIAMYSIIYQIVLILYNLITIVVKHNLITSIGKINISFFDQANLHVSLWLLVGIGFGINVAVIGFILLISYWNGFYRFIRGPIGKLLKKTHIIKDLEVYQQTVDLVKEKYRTNFGKVFSNWRVFIICFVCFFLYITISYSIPYFAGLSLNNESVYANFWDAVILSNFHQMVTCIIPTPGNSLFSELFFIRLFYPSNGPSYYSSLEVARASLLIWRSLSFIIPLFLACIMTIVYRPRKRHKNAVHQENQNIEE